MRIKPLVALLLHGFENFDDVMCTHLGLFIAHCRNVRGLGKSIVLFRLFQKLRCSNERSAKFERLEARVEVFRGGKWQNDSSPNITKNREFVWIG